MCPDRQRLPRALEQPLRKVLRAVKRRVRDRRQYLLLEAAPLLAPPQVPRGVTLLRVSAQRPEARARAVAAMRQANQPPAVDQRLAHGDEFYAWLEHDRVIGFGWVCFRDRQLGLYHYANTPGHAYLYNFHTDPAHRGRGLYPALLQHMRYELGRERHTQLWIDVRIDNLPSIQGVRKAGFTEVAMVGFDIWFGRYQRGLVLRHHANR